MRRKIAQAIIFTNYLWQGPKQTEAEKLKESLYILLFITVFLSIIFCLTLI